MALTNEFQYTCTFTIKYMCMYVIYFDVYWIGN